MFSLTLIVPRLWLQLHSDSPEQIYRSEGLISALISLASSFRTKLSCRAPVPINKEICREWVESSPRSQAQILPAPETVSPFYGPIRASFRLLNQELKSKAGDDSDMSHIVEYHVHWASLNKSWWLHRWARHYVEDISSSIESFQRRISSWRRPRCPDHSRSHSKQRFLVMEWFSFEQSEALYLDYYHRPPHRSHAWLLPLVC